MFIDDKPAEADRDDLESESGIEDESLNDRAEEADQSRKHIFFKKSQPLNQKQPMKGQSMKQSMPK